MPKDFSQFRMVDAVVRSKVEIEIVKAPNLAENGRYFGRTFLRFEFYQKIQK